MLVLLLFLAISNASPRAIPEDGGPPGEDAIRLADIQVLTLRKGYLTTGRRDHAVHQLQCVKGACEHEAQIDTVICHNLGNDGNGRIAWKCTYESNLTLFDFDVSCESYHMHEDGYVLKGSCGVEFGITPPPPPRVASSFSLWNWLVVFLLVCGVAFVANLWYSDWRRQQQEKDADPARREGEIEPGEMGEEGEKDPPRRAPAPPRAVPGAAVAAAPTVIVRERDSSPPWWLLWGSRSRTEVHHHYPASNVDSSRRSSEETETSSIKNIGGSSIGKVGYASTKLRGNAERFQRRAK